jgi:hypothetical protein
MPSLLKIFVFFQNITTDFSAIFFVNDLRCLKSILGEILYILIRVFYAEMSANYFDFSGKVQNDAKSGGGEQNVSLFRFAFVYLVFY